MKTMLLQIASVNLKFKVDDSFTKIITFLNNFDNSNNNCSIDGTVVIKPNNSRQIIISRDFKNLIIQGKDINNLNDPFNTIGILQAIFRFVGTKSPKNDIYLLHGSCAIYNNYAVFFGDDGDSTAKTLSSVECALISKKYIGDEFCFYNTRNNNIFSYNFIPIHIRDCVNKYLLDNQNFKLPNSDYIHSEAGYFFESEKLFKNIKSSKLKSIYFVHFGTNKSDKKLLSGKEAQKGISVCLTSHIVKLLNPSMDHMQFSQKSDSSTEMKFDNREIKRLLHKFNIRKGVEKIVKTLPVYRVTLTSPSEITKMI